MWEFNLEWWQACALLVDGGLAQYGKRSTERSRGKVEICGRCVWLQRAMMNGVLVGFLTSFVLIKSSQSVLSFKAVLSLTRIIG